MDTLCVVHTNCAYKPNYYFAIFKKGQISLICHDFSFVLSQFTEVCQSRRDIK